ncbi:MAG: hydroxymethylbilane synthase [Alphaproteobacteria bacterium]|nr:hydroxymethylbilane synthase [Alphaproteobacteria bacterium]
MKKKFKIGTRSSVLAKIQARIVRDFILKFHADLGENDIEIVPIDTWGDWRPGQKEQTFLDMGANKGLFTKEIEEALLAGAIDLAVHSMKDVPSEVTENLVFGAMIKRGDPRDSFVSTKAATLDALPAGSRVGTSSLRRQAQVLAKRPDLRVVPFRGNVDTRLRKLEEGAVEATLLAVAGLERLGRMDCIASILDVQTMLPAPGQGALGVQIRRDDEDMRNALLAVNDENTALCVVAERAALKVLDGSCRAPVAALAHIKGDRLTLDALAAKPDGTLIVRASREGLALEAAAIGKDLGLEIKGRLPCGFFGDSC